MHAVAILVMCSRGSHRRKLVLLAAHPVRDSCAHGIMTEADRRSRCPAGLARQRGGTPSPQEAALAAEAYENLAAVASGFAPAELLAPAPPLATFTGMARGLGLLPLPRDAPLSIVGGIPAAIGADAAASSAPNTVQQRQQQPLAAQELLRESPALAGRSSWHEECSQRMSVGWEADFAKSCTVHVGAALC